MRLGGPVHKKWTDPQAWAKEVAALNFRAALCPVPLDADDATVRAYAQAAAHAEIVIAEVGAWSNPLSQDEKTRGEALAKCKGALLMAEKIGARCAVNIAGSLGTKWDGPDHRDMTPGTFDLIVQSVRDIIDSVRPKRTFYTLEPMPWMYPDCADSYLRLIRAIDRPAFAVHYDPVNIVTSPAGYYENGRLIREFIAKLGPHIRSCHAKDILLEPKFTVHLNEVRPGLGTLDYRTFLHELNRLDPEMPLIVEHLPDAEEYRLAAEHIRRVAREEGIPL